MMYFWICGVCGMEPHEGNAVTSFAAAAVVNAINPNIPTRIEGPGSSGQKRFKGYSKVILKHMFMHEKSCCFR